MLAEEAFQLLYLLLLGLLLGLLLSFEGTRDKGLSREVGGEIVARGGRLHDAA